MTTKTENLNPRTCGSCYACCVHLGIDALNKWPGISCTHLDGSLGEATRCSIYKDRPHACSSYKCAWLGGIGDDDLRPDKSGLIMSIYPESIPGAGLAVTIQIFDQKTASTVLSQAINDLTTLGLDDIRVANTKTKRVIHFLQGEIREGALEKPNGPESLNFTTYDPPVGRYKIIEAPIEALSVKPPIEEPK